MRPAALLIVIRVLALVAVGTSAALLVDYVSFSPAFCSPGSGCSAVRASGFGYLFGNLVPVPALGIAGFLALFIVSFRPNQRSLLKIGGYVGGFLALGFIGLQAFKIKQFCTLCLIVDTSAIAIAVVTALYEARAEPTEDEPLRIWAWGLLLAGAIAGPLGWPFFKPDAPVPAGIKQFYVAGKINVVEFADFECPFCRLLHPTIQKLRHEYNDRVNFVRLNMPLERHEHAMDAAKAAVCGEAQNKKEQMAEKLFEVEDLSVENLRRIAVEMKLDPNAYDACIADPATVARIQRESKLLRDAGFQGLPTTYVGARQIVGALGEDQFREAFEQAARGNTAAGLPPWLYATLLAIGAGVIVFIGRKPASGERDKNAPSQKSGDAVV